MYDYTGVARSRSIALQEDYTVAGLICIDAQLMKIVLRNLLDNALKFTPRGGLVKLSAKETAVQVVVEITDTGMGMSTTQLGQLRDEAQLTSAGQDAEGHTSTGLGLRLSMRLVHRQGGNFQVNSEPHQGTRISLIFPKEHLPHHE